MASRWVLDGWMAGRAMGCIGGMGCVLGELERNAGMALAAIADACACWREPPGELARQLMLCCFALPPISAAHRMR